MKTCDRCRERRRAAYAADPECEKRRMAEYVVANYERVRGGQAAWHRANYERSQASVARWRAENPERHRENRRRDDRRRAVGRDRDAFEYGEVLRLDPCSYCGERAGERDHIDAVSDGGDNSWENLTAACRGCNGAKGTSPLLVFMARAA